MAPRSFLLSDEVADYVLAHAPQPDAVVRDLIAETEALGPEAGMQIGPDQAALMTLLTQLTGATSALEIGTFTGYSALSIARGLPPGGRLLCLDVSVEWTDIAVRYWQRAGVAERIELQIGPALDSLRALPAEPAFDLAFVDAHKPEYPEYLEEVAPRLRAGGLLIVDNVLRHGRVLPGHEEGDEDRLVQAFNRQVAADTRFDSVLLALADGLTLARRR